RMAPRCPFYSAFREDYYAWRFMAGAVACRPAFGSRIDSAFREPPVQIGIDRCGDLRGFVEQFVPGVVVPAQGEFAGRSCIGKGPAARTVDDMVVASHEKQGAHRQRTCGAEDLRAASLDEDRQ